MLSMEKYYPHLLKYFLLERTSKNLLLFALILLFNVIGMFTFATQSFAVTGVFNLTGNMTVSRQQPVGVTLQNGNVLIVGGNQYERTAELYDPSTGTFTQTASNTTVDHWYGFTMTILQNGKVLITGGIVGQHTSNIAELYDPTTNTFSQTGNMLDSLAEHTATLLPNGKVLIAGGEEDGFGLVSRAELYDPSTGTFSATGNINIPRAHPSATLLPNGKVLIVGGDANYDAGVTSEIYDTSTGVFSLAGQTHQSETFNTATLLHNGKVLIVGRQNQPYYLSAEIYDPSTDNVSFTGNLLFPRADGSTALLSNGKVLLMGGYDNNWNSVLAAEIYDPTTNNFTRTGNLNVGHTSPVTALISNGNILVVGGSGNNIAELYDPNGISNFPPIESSVTVTPNPVQINTLVNATTTFTDPDAGQTHTATANWGDGTNTVTTCSVTEPSGNTPGSINCPFSGYLAANVYPVTITVSDGTAQTTSAVTYASVFDPIQNSIFSAGERYSNPSSATPNTQGGVKFGLTYKYNGGTANQNRAFKLDFNAANLHFNATSVTSLVISNGMATLQGTGTLTGQTGTYNFLVTGVNNGGIRIQITDFSNNLIYDTQPGDPITATPTTSVTGHVVVH